MRAACGLWLLERLKFFQRKSNVARGGARSGAGRKKGRKNARTVEREQHVHQAAQLIEQALGDAAFAGDAHDFLMAVYKDTSHRLEVPLDAAKAAIAAVTLGQPLEASDTQNLWRDSIRGPSPGQPPASSSRPSP